MRLEELKSVPELRRWESLRWNLQAKGHSALEILSKIIERKCGVKINQKS